MLSIPDPGPLLVLIAVVLATCAKFYWFFRSRNWQTFADAMTRLGLAIFYVAVYLATVSDFGKIFVSNLWRIYARVGLIMLFLVEAIPWIVQTIKDKTA